MEIYFAIFLSSFKADILLSFYHEAAWFAALAFGGYDMRLATLCAITGASLASLFNFCIGWYLATHRNDWYSFDEKIYQKLKKYSRYSLVFLLFPFPDLPVMGQFFSLYVMFLGLFSNSLWRVIPLTIVGHLLYYSYYLATMG